MLSQLCRLPCSLLVHWPCSSLKLFCCSHGNAARRWELFPGAMAWSCLYHMGARMLATTDLPKTWIQDCSQGIEWLQIPWSGRDTGVVSRAGSHPLPLGAGEWALALAHCYGSSFAVLLPWWYTQPLEEAATSSSCKYTQNCKKLQEIMVILERLWAILLKKWLKAVSQIYKPLYLGRFLFFLDSTMRQ